MVGRFLAVVLGLAAAAGGSQAPGFTLQYMQNLNGRIDELRPIVEQFDRDVAAYNYTRAQAMAECETADGLLDALCNGYETTIRRFEELTAHFAELEAVGDYAQPLVLARSYKRDIAESVMDVFEPAVPATLPGGAYAGGAFAVVWGGLSFIFGLFGMLFSGGDRRIA
ncbi:MAG: DUF2937 family protein [Pseudomonadota bacterium]